MSRARLLGLVLVLAGCSGPATPAPSASAVPGSSPAGTPAATTAVGPSASGGPLASGQIAIDESLLRYLPASIGAIPVAYSADATNSVLGDAALSRSASSIAYGLAVDPASNDFVVAAVAKLRPGVFSDAFYRDWRSTYDRGACAQAGGVAGTAEATIAGRRTHIGTCNGGAHTYHVLLELPGIVISATSVGSKRFGEQLVSNLRP